MPGQLCQPIRIMSAPFKQFGVVDGRLCGRDGLPRATSLLSGLKLSDLESIAEGDEGDRQGRLIARVQAIIGRNPSPEESRDRTLTEALTAAAFKGDKEARDLLIFGDLEQSAEPEPQWPSRDAVRDLVVLAGSLQPSEQSPSRYLERASDLLRRELASIHKSAGARRHRCVPFHGGPEALPLRPSNR